ncbi:MAG: hypothetical protein ABI227_12175 [Rhodanobacter sp.]
MHEYRRQALQSVWMVLRRRIGRLLAPLDELDRMALQRELRAIGNESTSV